MCVFPKPEKNSYSTESLRMKAFKEIKKYAYTENKCDEKKYILNTYIGHFQRNTYFKIINFF